MCLLKKSLKILGISGKGGVFAKFASKSRAQINSPSYLFKAQFPCLLPALSATGKSSGMIGARSWPMYSKLGIHRL
jgi:hypothetical protein